MLRRVIKLLAAFGFMVWFLEAVVAAVRWWHGDTLTPFDRFLAATLPVLILLWARYFSVLACNGCAARFRRDQR